MSRHITDRERKSSDAARLRAYLEIDRAEMPHAESLRLQRSGSHAAAAGRRVKEFVRIERQREE